MKLNETRSNDANAPRRGKPVRWSGGLAAIMAAVVATPLLTTLGPAQASEGPGQTALDRVAALAGRTPTSSVDQDALREALAAIRDEYESLTNQPFLKVPVAGGCSNKETTCGEDCGACTLQGCSCQGLACNCAPGVCNPTGEKCDGNNCWFREWCPKFTVYECQNGACTGVSSGPPALWIPSIDNPLDGTFPPRWTPDDLKEFLAGNFASQLEKIQSEAERQNAVDYGRFRLIDAGALTIAGLQNLGETTQQAAATAIERILAYETWAEASGYTLVDDVAKYFANVEAGKSVSTP